LYIVPSYGRAQFAFPRLSAVVKKLIIGLFAAYVAQLLLENWLGVPVASTLAMTPGGPGLWQLLTYVLVDVGNPLMFLFGLLFIWWALSPFEIGYGPKRTLQLCLCALLGASVPAYLTGLLVPASPPLFGSSSLWFGGIAATTWLYADRSVSLFGMMAMSAKQFLLLMVGLSVLMFLASKNHTQLVASLGAMGGGIAFVRWMKRPRRPSIVRRPSSQRPSGFKVIQGGGGSGDDGRPKWLN
jgi:hypothetical protein